MNKTPTIQGMSFFDMTDKEKKKIIHEAADESNKMQAEMMKKATKKRDWTGIEPDGWKQSKCSQCISCKEPIFNWKKDFFKMTCFTSGCSRQGLLTIIEEPLK